MVALFEVLARLPLPVLHWLGGLFGWLVYLGSRSYAARLRENLQYAGLQCSTSELRKLRYANIREAGKGVLELPWVWRQPLSQVVASVRQCDGWQHVVAAQAQGKGV